MKFKLVSEFSPTGDQPQAIKELTESINNGEKFQTLLGVTGSGKTFTVANVIKKVNNPGDSDYVLMQKQSGYNTFYKILPILNPISN